MVKPGEVGVTVKPACPYGQGSTRHTMAGTEGRTGARVNRYQKAVLKSDGRQLLDTM